jgi:hypothetical protein
MSTRTDSCELRIDGQLAGRLDDLRKLWTAHSEGKEQCGELGAFTEYGLCFDYLPALTYSDQKEAFFRYQLSWGGPSDEFRFFVNPETITKWGLDGICETRTGK